MGFLLIHTTLTTKLLIKPEHGPASVYTFMGELLVLSHVDSGHRYNVPLMKREVKENTVKRGGREEGERERAAIYTQTRITSRPPTHCFQETLHMPA